MNRWFCIVADRCAAVVGGWHFMAATLILLLLWGALGPMFHFSDAWQIAGNSAMSVASLVILILLQSSQDRATAAMQAKMDELIRVTKDARNELIGIEKAI